MELSAIRLFMEKIADNYFPNLSVLLFDNLVEEVVDDIEYDATNQMIDKETTASICKVIESRQFSDIRISNNYWDDGDSHIRVIKSLIKQKKLKSFTLSFNKNYLTNENIKSLISIIKLLPGETVKELDLDFNDAFSPSTYERYTLIIELVKTIASCFVNLNNISIQNCSINVLKSLESNLSKKNKLETLSLNMTSNINIDQTIPHSNYSAYYSDFSNHLSNIIRRSTKLTSIDIKNSFLEDDHSEEFPNFKNDIYQAQFIIIESIITNLAELEELCIGNCVIRGKNFASLLEDQLRSPNILPKLKYLTLWGMMKDIHEVQPYQDLIKIANNRNIKCKIY